jgi:hypothetical protein
MPNYSKLEKDLLDDRLSTLIAATRAPQISAQDDAGLHRLLAEIEAEMGRHSPATDAAQPGLYEILLAASRRVIAERRKRSRPAKPAAAKAAAPAKAETEAETAPAAAKLPKATTTKTPAAKSAAAKPGKRAPASPTRKPAGRGKSETRKTDLRTGSRRITKAKVPAAAALPVPADEITLPEAVLPAADLDVIADIAASPDMVQEKALKKAGKDAEKAERKARKAADKAAKQALKDAAKAERKAAKQARKAERKLEEATAKAAKAAKKAAKADAGKDKSGKKDKPGKRGKSGKKADKAADKS